MGRFTRKIEQLKFAIYCYKRAQDGRFQRRVREIGQDDNLVSVERLTGEKESNILYLIDMEESHSGFFAEHNKLLAMLYFADYYHLTPVVKYPRGYCYAEDHSVNGTNNPFEYYFEQPCNVSLDEMNKYVSVIRSRKENSYMAHSLNDDNNGYSRSDRYLVEMGRITSKYIRLNQTVRRYIDDNIVSLGISDNCKTLGVHVRGTDFKQQYNGHPVQVTIDEYLEETVRLYRFMGYERVFLATDDSDAVTAFKEALGDRLVYYTDVMRSDGTDTVMHSTSDRENHHYLLGLEVLRDVYTLAACQGLVAGLSQVSYGARIQRLSTESQFEDLVILDKGINYHKRNNCPA